MGGIPVLLALAVVGVDYGYQPDGDGGIDYIVQVSPEHWDQAREAGEITSVIDPSVRGRVNRIVIRIGDEELPRDAGTPSPPDDEAATVSAAQALSPMPPPTGDVAQIRIAMADDDFVPAPDLSGNLGIAANGLGARVMRPDPQNQQEAGGGLQLPGREADGNGSSSAGPQRSSGADPATGRASNPNRSGGQNASSQTAQTSDDPLRRLSGGANSEPSSQDYPNSRPSSDSEDWVAPPSTDPRSSPNSGASETTRPGTQPRSAVAGRDDSNWSENPSADRGPSTASPPSTDGNAASGSPTAADRNPRATRPSQGFGAQPMSPAPRDSENYAPPNRGHADTPASLQDTRIAGYDRYGRPLNAAGELVRTTNQPVDRPVATEPPPGRGYNDQSYAQDYSDRYASADRARSQIEADRLASERINVPQYGQERAPAAAAREPSSPSDAEATRKAEQEIAAELAAARAALASADDAEQNQSVVSQPVFNFLLLVSLVANAYLVLTMSKLLQRYRNMVANMRSASTTAG